VVVALKPDTRLQNLTLDIRQMAAKMVADDGKIDTDDVRQMLKRATAGGHLTHKHAEDLAYVRERYKDKFTAGALKVMTSVLGPFIEDQIKQMKENQRRKHIEKQVLDIEERIELLKKDRKLRDLNLDTKTRVLLTDMFGRRRAGA
jgi:hypothetical protein